jgi:hypothetical protein
VTSRYFGKASAGLLQLGYDTKLVFGSPSTPPFNTGDDLHPQTCLCPLRRS